MSAMYAADDDRERAAAKLREQYVRGRLTIDELSDRTGRVFAARSRSDIRTALAGLPLLPDAWVLASQGRSFVQVAARGAMLLFFTSVYVVFTCTLLLIFALTMLFNGATGVTLLAFLVVWLVPTYLLTRLWRRKAG
jgi:Domain of unknown function (DUF1707)